MAISIDSDLCEGSGVCVAVCPENVFEQADGRTTIVNPTACTSCWLCVEQCATGAIDLD